jgi:hypothetical protein
VTDYGKLADRLKGMQSQTNPALAPAPRPKLDIGAFYEKVKAHIEAEMERANEELRKRRLSTIERVFVPSFRGRFCMTFGSDLLCSVELLEAKKSISVIISGPPNGYEIAKKEFHFGQEAGRQANSGDSAEQIAAEIVSGLLMGRFS